MIDDPLEYGPRFARAGADIVTFHAEVDGNPDDVIDAIEEEGAKAGMVVNPDTDVRRLAAWLDRCEMVLIMSVFPGFSGQKFIGDVLGKIRTLQDDLEFTGDIEIDGGITPTTAAAARKAGANVLVAGSAIFGQPDRAAVIRALREG
jgi:ribulose-phosphate 3-epimerase